MESEERKKAVKKAMKGDKESFTKLYGEIYVDMYRFACFMIGQAIAVMRLEKSYI